jgi:hypothetical protein
MRGGDRKQDGMWGHSLPEQRVPQNHPLRLIREIGLS